VAVGVGVTLEVDVIVGVTVGVKLGVTVLVGETETLTLFVGVVVGVNVEVGVLVGVLVGVTVFDGVISIIITALGLSPSISTLTLESELSASYNSTKNISSGSSGSLPIVIISADKVKCLELSLAANSNTPKAE
jgi:hypothetical protein